MVKEVHLRIDSDVTNIIEKMSKEKGCTNNEIYNDILKFGLSNIDYTNDLKMLFKKVDRLSSMVYYSRSLLEQVYADLNLNKRNPETSDNLIDFKKNFKKDKIIE